MTPRCPDGVRGVVLDFYGTLVRMVPPWPPSHRSVLLRRGLTEAAARWGDQWAAGPPDGALHLAHSGSERAYRAWELDRLRRRARACGVPEEEVNGVAVELDRVSKDLRLALFEDVPDALGALRGRGLVVAVCSNWFWDLEDVVGRVGLAGAVDVVVGSARAGARKPHPRIYRTVLDRCGLRPEQALFVGDMWETDVAGPVRAGMRAAHLRRPDRAVDGPAPPLPEGVVRIATLRALTGLL
ncbi:2-haloalkanoic acid dehalogenase [Streptomyces ruber]|uniref:2-haloalkanoic acid dehalogenase n=2 Tax=Streptomyces TaxID=1883 RepID=A0A918BHK0_9ACTN|nr:HAD family hydrolase [Streptomyces ruber]GGQ69355.1 2-haloalkanoic acid dehalogenase [Streptomyces ruber]